MNKDELLKLKAVSLYILMECKELDFIHLFKILYFAERNHYANYGKHLVKDTFCALERGPVPSFLYDALKVATGQKPSTSKDETFLAQAFEQCEAECPYIIRGTELPDMDELSKAEIASINDSIKANISKTSWQLSDESHDSAWHSAWSRQHSSPMNPSEIAIAGGATRGFVEYIESQERIDKYLSE